MPPATILLWYGAASAAVSLVTFVTYGLDKRAARLHRRRVRERTLHVMALLGGWPGALLAQQAFRHKTRKFGFQVLSWSIVVLHVGTVSWVCWG